MAKLRHRYSVQVDDNFHRQEEGARYRLGDFATLEEAVAACKKVVDQFLEVAASRDGTAAERYQHYAGFGPDPFITTNDPNAGEVLFSAWDYARQRCGA
jgi:hypothetical protein